jgi:hypothetical protein
VPWLQLFAGLSTEGEVNAILDVRISQDEKLPFAVFARTSGSQGGRLVAKFALQSLAEEFVAWLQAQSSPPPARLSLLQGGKR